MSDLHACPIEGCKHDDVTDDRVMCWKHWKMCPRDLQNQVYRWKKVSDKRGRVVPEHLQAIRAAIASVNDQCRRTRLQDRGIRSLNFPVWFNGDTRGIR